MEMTNQDIKWRITEILRASGVTFVGHISAVTVQFPDQERGTFARDVTIDTIGDADKVYSLMRNAA